MRLVALAVSLLGITAGAAQATGLPVVVVPGLTLADLPRLEERGAVGLLVPGAGPETNRAVALASLERGAVRNSLRGGAPGGPRLVEARTGPLAAAPGIYLGLPEGGAQPNDRRYPVVVVGEGWSGVLASSTTRIDGLVSVADLAPAARGEGPLRAEPRPAAADALLALDRRIRAAGEARMPVLLASCAAVAAVAVAVPAAAAAALALVLLANLALGLAGLASVSVVVPVLVAAAAAATVVGGRFRTGLLAGTVAAYLLALAAAGEAVALSPLGPTQNARFYGLSNLLATLLLVPALGGALLAWRRWGAVAGTAVAGAALVAVAASRLGADGGGAIVLAVGLAVLAVLAAGASRRALAAAVGAALAGVVLLVALDAATGGESHVTRALGGGPVGVARELAGRVALTVERLAHQPLRAVVVVLLAGVLAWLVARTLRAVPRREVALPLAVVGALAASLVVNDSPFEVLLAGVASYLVATGLSPATAAPPNRRGARGGRLA